MDEFNVFKNVFVCLFYSWIEHFQQLGKLTRYLKSSPETKIQNCFVSWDYSIQIYSYNVNAKASLNSLTYKPNDREETCERVQVRLADKKGKTSKCLWFFELISRELDFKRIISFESFSPHRKTQISTIKIGNHWETRFRVESNSPGFDLLLATIL